MKHDLTPDQLGVRYFSVAELRGWWYQTDPRWLVCADLLRECVGLIIEISPVEGAIGRHKGPNDTSDHNVDRWGMVYGIDIMPRFFKKNKKNKRGYREQSYEFYEYAIWCGFSAIGYYPQWRDAKGNQSPGFHLGTRRNTHATNPATWGGLKKKNGGYDYVSLIEAIDITDAKKS